MDLNRLEKQGIPTLGILTWYSVDNEASIGYTEFRDIIKEYNAPLTIMKAPKPENVFRRACEAIDFTFDTADDTIITFSMKDEGFHKTKVTRSLYAEYQRKDVTVKVKVVTAVLDKKTKDIEWEYHPDTTDIGGDALPDAAALAEYYIACYMEEHADALYALPIRESIRKAIYGSLCGVSLKTAGGGVYFIPRVNFEEFEAMALASYDIPMVVVEYIPCLDNRDSRKMVEDYLFNHLHKELLTMESAIDDLQLLLFSEEQVSAKKVTEIQDMIDAYKSRLAAYTWISRKHDLYTSIEGVQRELDRLVDGDEEDE
jgi:hypothetical protein